MVPMKKIKKEKEERRKRKKEKMKNEESIHYTNDMCFSDNCPGNLAGSEGFVDVSRTNVIFELLS